MLLEPNAGSLCEAHAGMCYRDARCPDMNCPGHPVRSCSTCNGGPCSAPEACHMPIADLRPISRRIFTSRRRLLPTTGEAWARLVGGSVGLAAAGALAHHFHLLF